MKAYKKVELLKQNDEDFEWYPTTNEILETIKNNIINVVTDKDYRYYNRSKIKYEKSFRTEEKDIIRIDSILDIGAGDGRVLEFLENDTNDIKFRIKQKLAIEKAKTQGNDLIKRGVGLIGRDFFDCTLLDKTYDIVFSNPPYTMFKEWVYKILNEVNSTFIYLVIPKRWDEDIDLKTAINQKGKLEVLGDFDFSNADRKARAEVQLLKITRVNNEDTFTNWIEQTFGKFESEVEEEIIETSEEDLNQLEQRSENNIKVLVENYNDDLYKLSATFKTLGSLDFSIIEQLGVKKEDVISKIKSDIASLKNVYWKKAFDYIKPITKRLTYKTRSKILHDIQWFNSLDFNEDNAQTVVIWVIENYNKYTKEQLLKVYDDLTDFENVKAYKSNDVWNTDTWRYTKPVPTKYSLDYRIVVSQGHKLNVQYAFQNEHGQDTILKDLQIVANSLGFESDSELPSELGKKHYCYTNEDILFEYKVYKNNNVHFKLNQKFLQILNIEVGKLRGWIKKPQDIQEEFDLSETEAVKYFTNTELSLLGDNNAQMLLSS